MERKISWCFLSVLVILPLAAVKVTQADPLSIYDIQYTADPSGNSPYMDSTIDCDGGLVINKWIGGSVKLTLWDPDYALAWGGIIVKDYSETGAFDPVEVGDWISFTDVLVEERSGNTQLSFLATSALMRDDNPGIGLPDPLEITDSQFGEPYESMFVLVADVQITALDLGPYADNYNLHNAQGDYWASDYMNIDKSAGGNYHPAVALGRSFKSVSGVLEHKIKYEYDFYQLLTLDSGSFVPEPGMCLLLLTGVSLLARRRRR